MNLCYLFWPIAYHSGLCWLGPCMLPKTAYFSVTGLATDPIVSFPEFFLCLVLRLCWFLGLYLLYVRCQLTIFTFGFLIYLAYIVKKMTLITIIWSSVISPSRTLTFCFIKKNFISDRQIYFLNNHLNECQ